MAKNTIKVGDKAKGNSQHKDIGRVISADKHQVTIERPDGIKAIYHPSEVTKL